MSERVNDETCELIQAYMVETERRIDAFKAMVNKQGRRDSSLAHALTDLHKEVCKVHKFAGLEMER